MSLCIDDPIGQGSGCELLTRSCDRETCAAVDAEVWGDAKIIRIIHTQTLWD